MSEATRSAGVFVNAIERATSLGEIETAFLSAMAHLGFEYAALFDCAAPGVGEIERTSFARVPVAWLERYIDQRYYEIDPVFSAVRRQLTPFSWNHPSYREGLTAAQQNMLDESDDSGMVDGLAMPIRGPNASLGCCTLVPDRNGADPEDYLVAHSLAVFAFASAERMQNGVTRAGVKLTARERECLLLAAQGKSDWAIGEVLKLSERTVHHAIESAKRRYGAATRVQAIVEAIAAGEFYATDAIG